MVFTPTSTLQPGERISIFASLLPLAVAALIGGLILGMAQWLCISHIRRSVCWMLVNGLAWPFALLLAIAADQLLNTQHYITPDWPPIAYLNIALRLLGMDTIQWSTIFGTGIITMVALITGITLVWLVSTQPVRDLADGTNTR
jgi:hypothetical protein